MPRGYGDYRLQDMQDRLMKLLKDRKVSQKALANEWKITQPRVSQKLSSMDITMKEMLSIVDLTRATADEVLRLFSKEDK